MIIKQLILPLIHLNANSPNTIFTNVKINSSIVTVVDNRCYVEYPIADHEPSIGNISRYTCKYINPSISKYPIAQSMPETKTNIYIFMPLKYVFKCLLLANIFCF